MSDLDQRKKISARMVRYAKALSSMSFDSDAWETLEQISLGLNREDSQRFVNERGCRG